MTSTTLARLHETLSSPLRCACCALLGSVPLNLGLNAGAYAQDAAGREIEEVVVTGSYIKRDKFDMASPLEVIGGVGVLGEGSGSVA